jgi:serine/threonine protein kinase
VVKKLYVKTPEEANSNLKEVFAMVSLNHPSIVKVRSGLIGKGFQYVLIVMDYYPDGDLEKEIKRRATMRQPWSEVELDSIFNSLISGYAYMQKEHKLAHLDIKPQNILKKGNQYFIAGLRCAFKSREGESDSIAGTPAYLSPSLSKAYSDYSKGFRVSNFKHNAYKSDVYSLGLTFFYMATLTPFDELRIQLGDQQFNIHVLKIK